MSAIILDCETTDKDPKTCEVVELAWKEYQLPSCDGPMSPVTTWHYRFGHTKPMMWGALATHHILPEELAELPPFHDLNRPDTSLLWIGHNIDFDWECLGKPPTRRICTLAMARKLWPTLDSHTLSALVYYTQGASRETREKLRSAHSASADVNLCQEVLDVIVAEAGIVDFEHLYSFSEEARVPTIWTFGKFKGEPIEAADRGYANWYRRQTDTDPYLLEALRRCGLI